MSITGQKKKKKSFLAMDLALRISAGEDWMGYSTTQGEVPYINLEISKEKFQERVKDIQNILQYNMESLIRFHEKTIRSRNLAIDEDIDRVQKILDKCTTKGFRIDTLFIDPRAKVIRGSENEETTIKDFCDNIDKLLAKNPGLSVVIVTHMGKDPTRGAIGHSRFSGWLDTEISISMPKSEEKFDKRIEIIGRDAEDATMALNFKYPMHYVDVAEQFVRNEKVNAAVKFIIEQLGEKVRSQQKLRQKAMIKGISDYAFYKAIRELKDQKRVKSVQAKGVGNKKLLKLDES